MIYFSNYIEIFLQDIKFVKTNLYQVSDHYNCAVLNNILNRIVIGHCLCQATVYSSLKEMAKEIFLLSSLGNKLNKISQKISHISGSIYLIRNIYQRVIPTLKIRRDRLELELKQRAFLPQAINYQTELAKAQNMALANFNLTNQQPSEISTCERQIFNLLLDKMPDRALYEVEHKKLAGSFEIYSTLAYFQALDAYKNQLPSQSSKQKQIARLLNKQAKAIAIAQKTTSLNYEAFRRRKKIQGGCLEKEEQEKLITYYEVLSDVNSVSSNKSFSLKQEDIPLSIIVHGISKEILNAIHQLQVNDYLFFCLGAEDHVVTIEIGRLQNNQHVEEYRLINFNTGDQIYNNTKPHSVDLNNRLVKPLGITGLSLGAFEYSFIEGIVALILKPNATGELYALEQKYLVNKHGGQWQDNEGSWYPMQEKGTCPYSSLEVCLNSHLDTQDIVNLNVIKSELSIGKQQQILNWRKKQYRQYQRRQQQDTKISRLMLKEIKQSERILNLVHLYHLQAKVERAKIEYSQLTQKDPRSI